MQGLQQQLVIMTLKCAFLAVAPDVVSIDDGELVDAADPNERLPGRFDSTMRFYPLSLYRGNQRQNDRRRRRVV